MDEDISWSSVRELQRCNYRFLQRLAKSMGLPSNVKKAYLVQLIYTKQNCSPEEVASIVNRVKMERLVMSNIKAAKKIRLQGAEVSSTNSTFGSPSIGQTPKRSGTSIQSSPNSEDVHYPDRDQPIAIRRTRGSDRVLRSSNVKKYKRPNYAILNNTIIGVVSSEGSDTETQINVVTSERTYAEMSTKPRCVVVNKRSLLKTGECFNSDGQMLAAHVISGPLVPMLNKKSSGNQLVNAKASTSNHYELVRNVSYRRNNGKVTKIKALVHKARQYIKNLATVRKYGRKNQENRSELSLETRVEVTIQDIINSNIDAQTFTQPNPSEYVMTESNNINYPNMCGLTDVNEYYHKKIRAEQVRYKHVEVARVNERNLPNINVVFSNYSGISNEVTLSPLYVQVSSEMERSQSYPVYEPIDCTSMLETLYNFKSPLLTNQPLLQIATTANTKCVYSSTVIANAMQPPATVVSNDQCYVSSYEQCSQYPCKQEDVSLMDDLLSLGEQDITLRQYHEVHHSYSTSNSLEESQDARALVTTPQLEDALEIISQDGDYMERLGLDVRMQCILCSWAGPKLLLSNHLRKDHSDQIMEQGSNEWNITFKLGTLVNQPLWLSHVSQFQSSLYILSVKYEDPNCIMLALSTLSDSITRGSMTIYNKVTGQPYTWLGDILQLPTDMPYRFDTSHMKLELTKLNLLPNSANLQLLNRELVTKSPTKVVVGQPDLNDIHIIIFVSIYD